MAVMQDFQSLPFILPGGVGGGSCIVEEIPAPLCRIPIGEKSVRFKYFVKPLEPVDSTLNDNQKPLDIDTSVRLITWLGRSVTHK